MTQNYHTNDIGDKNFRKIDIINQQFKNGKITKEERDKRINEIHSNTEKDIGTIIPKNGSESVNIRYQRPNKEKSNFDFNKIKKGENKEYIDGVLDDNTFEKFKRHLDICQSTDDYREYLQHHRELCKMIGCDLKSVLYCIRVQKGNKISLYVRTDKTPANIEDGTILYHTTTVKNLNRLNGTFRSKDGALYPSKRVYFTIGKPGSRLGGNSMNNTDFIYKYTGDISKAFVDQELRGGNAVYIETETSLPVTLVTK